MTGAAATRSLVRSLRPQRPPRAIPVLQTELREAPHRDAVLLVRPGELEPEFPLRERCRGLAAREQEPQRRIALGGELMDARLQRAELVQGPPRQNPQSL